MKANLLLSIHLALIVNIFSTSYYENSLQENTKVVDTITGKQMKYYSIQIPNDIEDKDLLVDANLINKHELVTSPIVVISLEQLPNTNFKQQWLCNQIGQETCFIPNKYLKSGESIYLGIFCKDCQYDLSYSFIREVSLTMGENKLFHLKEGDSKIFTIKDTDKIENFIDITTLNLRMSKFTMQVEIVDKSDPTKTVNAPVSSNWIGGQSTIIKPKNIKDRNFEYRITINALENGIFNVEAKSENTLIQLNDLSLKFETINSEKPVCYSYRIDASSSKEDLLINIKSVKGDLDITLAPNNNFSAVNAFNFKVDNSTEKRYVLSSNVRNKNTNGDNWSICVKGEKTSYYTLQVFTRNKTDVVKDYKKLLYSNLELI